MSDQPTLWDTTSATSSPASGGGPSPCDSPTGLMTGPSGLAPVPASPSAQPARVAALRMPGISGPSSGASSRSAALQSSLESRLRQRLAGTGSPLYALTWKHWAMAWGPPICALRARAHPTSGNGSTGLVKGWTTPTAHDGSPRSKGQKAKHGTKHGCADLNHDAQRAGWATATSRDHKDGACDLTTNPVNALLGRAVLLSGLTSNGSPAGTGSGGQLNPEFTRWLMGYPVAWGSCGATAMRLCLRSPRRSSKRTSTPSE